MSTLTSYLVSSFEKFPERTAIFMDDEKITYEELYHYSANIANLLGGNLDCCSANVAIYLPKSITLYVAIYGVLFSGNCFVPIDYSIPLLRLQYLIKNSSASCLITTWKKIWEISANNLAISNRKSSFRSDEVIAVFINFSGLDLNIEQIISLDNQHLSFAPPVPCILESANAYLLYTSGSTGKPKGILHTHKSACTFVDWATDHLLLNQHDRIIHKTSVAFDLSIFDIFATFKVGATLVPFPEYLFNHPLKLFSFINKKKITILYTVPSTITNNISPIFLGLLKSTSLRYLIFAGEKIQKNNIRKLFEYIPTTCRVQNWYGPTETNVVSYYEIKEHLLQDYQEISIGRPCNYAEFRLVNSTEIMKILAIKSDSMMKNYWNLEELNRISFLLINGTRYYYSGDLVEIVNAHYILKGRIDRQIKYNGYRIQLEEIESAIFKQDKIEEAVAEFLDNKLYLVVRLSENISLSNAQIKSYCAQYLPNYMLPDEVIITNFIPRNEREKIDFIRLKQDLIRQNKLCLSKI